MGANPARADDPEAVPAPVDDPSGDLPAGSAESGARRGEHARPGPRFRWVVLAAGVLAQGAFIAVPFGLPTVAVPLRDELSASSAQLGLVLGAPTIGMVATLYLWGRLSDRVGESRVVTVGLLGAGAALAVAAAVHTVAAMTAALAVAGAFGSSANTASGRAVMAWFPGRRRGLAMGIRQTSLPLSGAISALVLPPLMISAGVGTGLAVLGLGCAAAGLVAGRVLARPAPDPLSLAAGTRPPLAGGEVGARVPAGVAGDSREAGAPAPVPLPVPGIGAVPPGSSGLPHPEAGPCPSGTTPPGWWRRAREASLDLRTICVVSGLLVVPQITLAAFGALYLHDDRGLSVPVAAAVLAVAQVLGAVGRIMTGVWSDRAANRTFPLFVIIVGQVVAVVAVAAASESAPLPVLCGLLVAAVGLTMSWNTLGFVIAGESARPGRAGTALGTQNSIAVGFGGLTPIVMAPLLDTFGWTTVVALLPALPVIALLVALRSIRGAGG